MRIYDGQRDRRPFFTRMTARTSKLRSLSSMVAPSASPGLLDVKIHFLSLCAVTGRSFDSQSGVTLERIEFGGARVSIAPTTGEIGAALRSLSPPRDLVLLMRGIHRRG